MIFTQKRYLNCDTKELKNILIDNTELSKSIGFLYGESSKEFVGKICDNGEMKIYQNTSLSICNPLIKINFSDTLAVFDICPNIITSVSSAVFLILILIFAVITLNLYVFIFLAFFVFVLAFTNYINILLFTHSLQKRLSRILDKNIELYKSSKHNSGE